MNLKRCFGLLLALSVCCACISVSLAEEVAPDAAFDPSEPSPSAVVSSSPAPLSLALPQPLEVAVTLVEPEIDPAAVSPSPEPSPVISEIDTLQDGSTEAVSASNTTRDLQDGVARPDGSITAALTSILGEYSPATYQTVTYMDGATVVTTEVVSGLAGLDWPWIASAGIFALMLFCLFKLLGGLWK